MNLQDLQQFAVQRLAHHLQEAGFTDKTSIPFAITTFAGWFGAQTDETIDRWQSDRRELDSAAGVFSQGFIAGWKSNQVSQLNLARKN